MVSQLEKGNNGIEDCACVREDGAACEGKSECLSCHGELLELSKRELRSV